MHGGSLQQSLAAFAFNLSLLKEILNASLVFQYAYTSLFSFSLFFFFFNFIFLNTVNK